MKWNDLPIEIQNRMLDCQEEQGNKRDAIPFEQRISIGKDFGGFDWEETREKSLFWIEVLGNDKIETFYERYPKEEEIKAKPFLQQIQQMIDKSINELKEELRKDNTKDLHQQNKKLATENELLKAKIESLEEYLKEYKKMVFENNYRVRCNGKSYTVEYLFTLIPSYKQWMDLQTFASQKEAEEYIKSLIKQ